MHNTNHQRNAMGQILHSCAATTAALRRTIQNSQESLKAIADHYHINVKTVAKWRKRTGVEDSPMGPRKPQAVAPPGIAIGRHFGSRQFGSASGKPH
jgi:hypothetical protein